MSYERRALSALLFLAVSTAAIGCGSSAPILLHPKMPTRARPCPDPKHSFAVSVNDRRGYADLANVGFTQTGMSNVKASLRTSPPPAGLVDGAVRQALKGCDDASAQREPIQLSVDVTRFQTTEVTGFTSEEITAEIELRVRAARGEVALSTFDVKADAQDSGMDTTDSAEGVIAEALAEGTERFVAALAKHAAQWPADAPAPASDAQAATTSVALAADKRVRISAHRMSAEREDELFDERLNAARLVPIEIEIEVIAAGDPIAVRRDGVSARFSGGATAIALDTRKVEEEVRVFAGINYFFGGIAAASAAQAQDDVASKKASRGGFDVTYLESLGQKLSGLLFFTSSDAARTTPNTIDVELSDPVTGHSVSAHVGVTGTPNKVRR